MLSKLFFFFLLNWFYKHHWLASFYLSVRQIWVSSTSAYMFLASVCSVLWTWLIHVCQINPHGAGWKTANMTSEWITGAAVAAVCLQGGEQDVCLGSPLTTCDMVLLHFHPSTTSGPQDWWDSDDERPEEDVTEGTLCIFSASILEFQDVHSTPPIYMENHHGFNCPVFPVHSRYLGALLWIVVKPHPEWEKPELICCTELPGWISITSRDNFPIHPLPDKSHYPGVILEAQ